MRPRDMRARIVTSERGLIVFTVRNMDVKVRVELHGEEPRIEREEADHVVMGSFHTSGRIVIAGLMDWVPDAARASVPPGTLRAMVVFTGLDTLSEDGLDGDDRYVVHLWPGESIGVTVLRQWQGNDRMPAAAPPPSPPPPPPSRPLHLCTIGWWFPASPLPQLPRIPPPRSFFAAPDKRTLTRSPFLRCLLAFGL